MATTEAAPTFFARKATGLVRESSLWNTAAFNILNVTVAYAILYPALFAWQFPGSNLLLGGIIAVAAFVPLGLVYAMVVAAMPRSGSDYVFVSRVFHPAVGFIVAPWTTLLYAWMWAINSDSVSGWEWLVVGVGVVLDLAFLAMVRRLMR